MSSKNFSEIFQLTAIKLSDPKMGTNNCVYVQNPIGKFVEINYKGKTAFYRVLHFPQSYVLDNNETAHMQIMLNTFQREYLAVPLESIVDVKFFMEERLIKISSLIAKIQKIKTKSDTVTTIDDEFIEKVKEVFDTNLNPIMTNHKYSYENKFIIVIENINLAVQTNETIKNTSGCPIVISPDTKITFFSDESNVIIDYSNVSNTLFKADFNFEKLGIGGLSKEFEIMFRRAFSSRIIPNKILKNMGINHTKGIILHGPPGCGKTLIARQIGKILNCVEPKIITGPSLLNAYIGQSESNVRSLFAEAIADKSGKKLHLIILDEFDSIGQKRGSQSGAGGQVSDNIVNQFLSMIDGPESLNNILLIAMTNNLHILDEALLRPGRFEVQIEISLPNLTGRNEILKIHTKKLSDANYIDPEVELSHIAENTVNYTGAELEGVIKCASSYAMSRLIDPTNMSVDTNQHPLITQTDFTKAIKEIKPQFGKVSNEINIICNDAIPFLLYSDIYENTYNEIKRKIGKMKNGKIMSFLIDGPHYIGKTTLVSKIAKEMSDSADNSFTCIKFISSSDMLTVHKKAEMLLNIFNQCLKSESFLIILDSVEKIISYSKLRIMYDNDILQVIYLMMSKIIETEKKGVIIMTSSEPELMESLNLNSMCTYSYNLTDDFNPIFLDNFSLNTELNEPIELLLSECKASTYFKSKM